MDNNVRGPTKHIVRTFFENNDLTLKEVAEHFEIPYGTVRNWKYADRKNDNDWIKKSDTKKVDVTKSLTRRELKTKAKTLVIAGDTIKEAAEKTGLKESVLQNYSAKEKWMESRKAFNDYSYKFLIRKKGESHLKDRELALTATSIINKLALKELQEGNITLERARTLKEVSEVLTKNITLAGKLLGIKDIDKVDFDELDEELADDGNKLEIEVFESWRS